MRSQAQQFFPARPGSSHRRPRPAFPYVRLIPAGNLTPEEEAFIADLRGRFVDGLTDSYVRATPDYLLGWVCRSPKSKWTGTPDYYCVKPLGHVLVGALAEALGAGRPYGLTLQDRRYLYVRGRGEDGSPVELAFDWYDIGDEEYEEAQMLVRFVEAVRA